MKKPVDPVRKAKAIDALCLLANAPAGRKDFDVVAFIADIAKDLGYIKPDEDTGHDG